MGQREGRSSWLGWSGVGLVALLGAGCVGGDLSQELSQSEEDGLLNGSVTSERPEIGRISGCTATLIAPNVAITAAHCVSYQTREQAGAYDNFTVDRANGRARSFVVERFRSFASEVGAQDIALLRLAQPVPPDVASPTTLATRPASRGEQVTIFGYGCTERRTESGSFTKRKFTFDFGPSANLCPGDSGGPVVMGTTGPLVLINSGYWTNNGRDIFGEPTTFRQTLLDQIARWDSLYGAPALPESITLTNATGAGLWVRCDGADGPTCTGWTLAQPGGQIVVVSPGRRLVLDNQDLLPAAPMNLLRVTAPSSTVTAFANPANPFSPPQNPDPQPDPVDPGLPEEEPGGDPEPSCAGGADRGAAVALVGQINGRICAGRDSWFSVELALGQRADILVSFTHAQGDLDIALHGPDGARVARSTGTADAEQITWAAAQAGPHTLRVYGYNGVGNAASITIAREGDEPLGDPGQGPDDGRCAEEPDEPNDRQADAGALTPGAYPGAVCGADSDWYRIETSNPWSVSITFNHGAGDLDLQAVDADGRQTAISQSVASTERVQGSGPGFIRVYGYGGATGSYTLTLE